MKSAFIKFVIITNVGLAILFATNSVFAADNPINVDTLLYKFQMAEQTANPTTTDYIAGLPEGEPANVIADIVKFALIVANILAFISLVIAGIFMLMSQGNDEEIGKAKKIFYFTVFAVVICATVLAVVTGIANLNFFQ